ncbi:MAG TPA: hypothetical protein VK694_00820 [Verrucomicrobiae bacterium]|nr:hypothetical protein [Verrucomicrobiae bacterium]
MLVIALYRWWYGSGWLWAAARLRHRLSGVGREYSVNILLKTMFSPWKQIISSSGAQSTIGLKFNMMIDNLVSRMVGFTVRSLTLMAAGFIWLTTLTIGLVILIAWPIIPLLFGIIPLYAFGVIA